MKSAVPSCTDPRRGMALFGILMILASLSLIAGTVFSVVRGNVAIAGHLMRQQESFFQADAAVQYVQSQLSRDVMDGTVDLDQPTIPLNYASPPGFSFDPVTNLTRLANPDHYLLEVTGRSQGAATRIEAVLGRENTLGRLGVFGDRDLRIQPGFDIYSYRSDKLLNPTPADSTGDAGVGSNQSVSLLPGAGVDGVIILGAALDGTGASIAGAGAIPVMRMARIDPDPLGAAGGPLAASFAHYSNPLNNDNVAGGIADNTIDVPNHQAFTLHGGVYYLTSFELGSHAELYIDSTPEEPAVIFLTGPFRCQPSTTFSSTSGSPRALYIFASGSGEFRIQPNSSFRGMVYAPYADLRIQPSGDLYGVFWGGEIRLQPNGDLYIDLTLLDEFKSGVLETVQWKEVRS
jgi:hypothetical protein